jgi:ferredoxin
MINLKIDGISVTVDDGTTVLDAARKVGVEIPTLCHFETSHPGPFSHRRGGIGDEGGEIEPPVSCSVCAVKIDGRNGFVPSCVALAEEGMVVESNTEAVFKSRRQALELLLSHHNGDCDAPCTRICPCSIDIPELVRKIITGDKAGMIRVIRAAMPFPAVLAHICSAPCEKGCRRKQVDTAVSIRELHKFAAITAMSSSESSTPSIQPSTGKKVAIVGAGLAGLTAAYHLSCLGHACTVVERNSRPGGPLVNQPCEHQLPANILDYEIDWIRKCGVIFQFDTEVTSLQELRTTFDATVIACGSQSMQWIEQQGIRCTERGIEVQKGTFATSVDSVFAIGGAIVPGKHSSRTVGQSTKAAQAIHRSLMGINDFKPEVVGTGRDLSLPPVHIPFDSSMGKLSGDDLTRFADSIPSIKTKTSESPEPSGTDRSRPVRAVSEIATRCLQCDCGKKTGCDLRRYAAEYGARQNTYKLDKPLKSERQIFQSGLVYEPGKCILCGRCVGVTNAHRLNTRSQKARPLNPPAGDLGGAVPEGQNLRGVGLTFFNRGSDLYVDSPFGEPMDQAMGDCMDRCIDACPTGALWRIKHSEV